MLCCWIELRLRRQTDFHLQFNLALTEIWYRIVASYTELANLLAPQLRHKEHVEMNWLSNIAEMWNSEVSVRYPVTMKNVL